MLKDLQKITGILKKMMAELAKLKNIFDAFYWEQDFAYECGMESYEDILATSLMLSHLTAIGIINRAARQVYGTDILKRPSSAFVSPGCTMEFFYYREDLSISGDTTDAALNALGLDITYDCLNPSGEESELEDPRPDEIEIPDMQAKEDKDFPKRLKRLFEVFVSKMDNKTDVERVPEIFERMVDNASALMGFFPYITVREVFDYVYHVEMDTFQGVSLFHIKDERPKKLLRRLRGGNNEFYKEIIRKAHEDMEAVIRHDYAMELYSEASFPCFDFTFLMEESDRASEYACYSGFDYQHLDSTTFGALFATKVYDDYFREEKKDAKNNSDRNRRNGNDAASADVQVS